MSAATMLSGTSPEMDQVLNEPRPRLAGIETHRTFVP